MNLLLILPLHTHFSGEQDESTRISYEVKPKDPHYNDLQALGALANEQLGKKDLFAEQSLSESIENQRNLLNQL